jgi:hypothetical protein
MNVPPTEKRFIWATRGRTWGFRFLVDGGFADPLDVYDELFGELGEQPEAWRRAGDKVALRFPDPEERQDASGRVIPHEFVLVGGWADGVSSLSGGRKLIWPRVAAEFSQVWNRAEAPSTRHA